ncbi:MAG: glycosyltransferase family 2 protein [Rhodospirillales bacterium]|nr:glycosyltransferase family 2 protein [Rhodospirillales bacterium]
MRTKDRALLLPRALRSVLAQNFTNWRLYLVNDGGNLATLENVLAPFRNDFGDRLSIVSHTASLGMEAASNAGLAAASGRYFAIHDDDDRWDATFLSRTVAFLDAPENDSYIGIATGCDVVQERIKGDHIETVAQFPWIYFQPPITFGAMIERNQIPPITLLLRRALLNRIGGYNEALPVLGDWEFILRALAVGDIGALEERLAFYHHRLSADMPVYANSVTGGINIHSETRAKLGNYIVRETLQQQPALLGVLWPVLQAQIELTQKLESVTEELRAIRQVTEPLRLVFALLRRLFRKRGA